MGRTSNHLSTAMEEPQITYQHKLRFHALMRDIGCANDIILDSLWANIEQTIRPEIEESVDEGDITQNDVLSRLENENIALKKRLDEMQKKMDAFELKWMSEVMMRWKL